MWFCPLAQMRTLFALPSAHNVATKTSKNRNVTLTGFMCFHTLHLWNITCDSQQHVRAHESEAYCDTYCYYVISTSNFCHRLWICHGLDVRLQKVWRLSSNMENEQNVINTKSLLTNMPFLASTYHSCRDWSNYQSCCAKLIIQSKQEFSSLGTVGLTDNFRLWNS